MKRSTTCCLVGIALLFALCVAGVEAQLKCEMTDDPAKVQVFYGDIGNFVRVLDLIDQGGDPKAVLQREYLDTASPGLKECLREKGTSVEEYVEALEKRPEQSAAFPAASAPSPRSTGSWSPSRSWRCIT